MTYFALVNKSGKSTPISVTGGVHGSNRLGGNATADVLTFGRIAAKTALGLNK